MKFIELFPLQTYINLDSRQDRDMLVKEEFKKIDIAPMRVSGTVIKATDNAMWNGVLGCTLSHIKCLEMALERKQNIFIFEDDVKLINNYKEIVVNAFDELNKLDWDMIYLGGNVLKPIYQKTNYLGKLTHCQSTVSYGVNYHFVEKLLSYIPRDRIIPIDLVYTNEVIPRHNCYISIPMVVVQRDSYSNIEGRSVEYESYLERRYNKNLIYMEQNEL